MNNGLERAQDVFLNGINQICSKFGLNNIMAQLYATLYLSTKPMSLDDMVERLKISKGSASINIRALERYGVVRRVWVKGSRKDYYEAELDITKVVSDRVQSMAKGRLLELDDMIRSVYSILDSLPPAGEKESDHIKVFRCKIDKLNLLYQHAKTMLDVLSSAMIARTSI